MECQQVKEALQDYMDGTLGRTDSSIIEAHVASCQSCTKDYQALLEVRRMLTELSTIKAPVRLFYKVRRRIERPTLADRLYNLWKYPLKIKIPVAAAALAFSAVLALALFRTEAPKVLLQPSSALKKAAVVAPSLESLKDKARKAEPAPVKEEAEEPPPSPRENHAVKQAIAGKEMIQLALLIKVETEDTEEPATGRSAPQGDAKEKRSTQDAPAPPAGAGAGAVQEKQDAAKPEEDKAASSGAAPGKMESAAPTPRQEESPASVSTKTPSPDEDERNETIDAAVAKIKRLSTRLKGKVITIDYVNEDKEPKSITIEIPAASYDDFLKKSARIGTFSGTPPQPPAEAQGMVILKIQLIPSEE